jgi:uncharacterized membrane protein
MPNGKTSVLRVFGRIWLAAFVLAAIYFILLSQCLPEKIAVHFDFSGRPNGFGPRDGFLMLFGTIGLVTNGLLWLFSRWTELIPDRLIHLPHKEEWLATPELRLKFYDRLRSTKYLLGAVLNIIFAGVQQIVYQYNMPDPFFRLPAEYFLPALLVLPIASIFIPFFLFKPPVSGWKN